MAKLEDVLRTRSSADEARFRDRLQVLEQSTAIRKQAVKNLWFDTRPPASVWDAIIDAVVAAPNAPAYLEDAIRIAVRANLLCGPVVSYGSGTRFGRAVPFERLADEIYAPPPGSSRPARPYMARRWLRSVLKGDLSLARRLWRTRNLGRFVMWGTFEFGSADPFGPPPRRATDIRADLGLRDEKGELVLLTYELPHTTDARFPTVAEAYASFFWPYHFSPAASDAACGMTLPWATGGRGIPRPEVVHAPVSGAMLVRKPERAR